MEEIRKIIREIIEETLILELNDISDLALFLTDSYVVLYDAEELVSGTEEEDYDKMQESIVGVLEVRKNDKYDTHEVEQIWATGGYGPNLYLLGMSVFGSLTPTRIHTRITDEAKYVWKQFYDGKGANLVNYEHIEDGEGNLGNHHEEEYLNKVFSIKNPIDHESLQRKHYDAMDRDALGYAAYQLETDAEALLNNAMSKAYNW